MKCKDTYIHIYIYTIYIVPLGTRARIQNYNTLTYRLPHSQIYNNMELIINPRYVETADAIHMSPRSPSESV